MATDVTLPMVLERMRSLDWRLEDFRFLRLLARGRLSTVYLATHVSSTSSTTGMKFAIKKYGAVDCWAIGLLTHECLLRRMPWGDSNVRSREEWLRSVRERGWATHLVFTDSISDRARRFVSSCLRGDPGSRITARDMSTHPCIAHETREGEGFRHGVASRAMRAMRAWTNRLL